MNPYIRLSFAAALPALISFIFCKLDSKTGFGKLSYASKQTVYGIVFGALAILGTEFGIPISGAQINCRDGAVVVAGLLFGAPAGIVAGLIGGIERWFSVYWGIGAYTRVACSVSTVFAGFYAAGLRKLMFEDSRPGRIISLVIGMVIEVFHLTMVFVTNLDNPLAAMEVVKNCNVPMIVSNSFAVLLASVVMACLDKKNESSGKTLAKTLQVWLLLAVSIAFSMTTYFVIRIQNSIVLVQADASSDIAYEIRDTAVYINTFLEILVFALLFAVIYFLIKRIIVDKIHVMNSQLSEIISGNLDQVVDVDSCREFGELSNGINSTVNTLKTYIEEAATRLDKELEFAKTIQTSVLPLPSFSDFEFDVYAQMYTAKEVGGDFYDYYKTGVNTLNFVIADVSGKGIPAALFMMRAKTELRTLTEDGYEINEVFELGNNALCSGNGAGVFVTTWQGSLNLESGVLSFVNAGHNPPLILHGDGKCRYLETRRNLVLAAMEDTKYRTETVRLEPGDVIFLYTDGVTEATDSQNNLYGSDRLMNAVSSAKFSSMKDLCDYVKNDVDGFVKDADQFDDITMLAVRYKGKPESSSLHFDSIDIADISEAIEFTDKMLEKVSCPVKETAQVDIAIDEILSNIVKHAYQGTSGPVDLTVKTCLDSVEIRFADKGPQYNPLLAEDADSTLSAEERKVGGLGIFIVKKTMNKMLYEYSNGSNILTVKKDWIIQKGNERIKEIL